MIEVNKKFQTINHVILIEIRAVDRVKNLYKTFHKFSVTRTI